MNIIIKLFLLKWKKIAGTAVYSTVSVYKNLPESDIEWVEPLHISLLN
jgi:hypothetical protein